MSPEFIKLFAPVLIFAAWVVFALRIKTPMLIGAGLFFASYAGFSANFSFVYREIHQLIQIFLIICFLGTALLTARFNKINYIPVVFLLFIIVSLAFAPFDNDARLQLINYIVCILVVNYLFSTIGNPQNLIKLMNFYATLSLLLSFIGFAEFVHNTSGRVETTFSNPNYYGFFLGVGYCVVYANWRGLRKYIALVMILFAIIMSGSRGAVILPVLQVLWSIYLLRSFHKVVYICIPVVIIILIVVLSGMTRFTASQGTEGSDAERIIFAQIALRMANNHPFSGVGWGRFINEFGNYSTFAEQVITSTGVTDVSNQDRRVSHNDFLRILAELGWIASFMFAAITIYGAKIVIKFRGSGHGYLLPIWLGLLLFSLGHNNMNSALFWFIFLLPYFIYSSNYQPFAISRKSLI